MLADGDSLRPAPRSSNWSVTLALLAVNAVVFILQITVLPKIIPPGYLALSLDGLKHGYVWQLFTYQFLHATPWPWHLLLNCWALYMFGREVEWRVGKLRFLLLYFASGVVGGLFQALVSFVWPHYFHGSVVGASAGVCGVVAAFAMFFPLRQFTLLLFFFLPVHLRAKSLLWVTLILTTLGIAYPNSAVVMHILGNNVAHAAHLGGILTGLFFTNRSAPA